MKKVIIIVVVFLILVWLTMASFTTFELNCRGDICSGPRMLVYKLVKNGVICSMVNGSYNMNIAPLADKQRGCYVTSNWLCKLRGGNLKDQNISRGGAFILPEPAYYCSIDDNTTSTTTTASTTTNLVPPTPVTSTKSNVNIGEGVIKGKVLLGPTCPVERIPPDPNCAEKPYQTKIQVIAVGSLKSSPYAVVDSNANGEYTVTLPVGEYALQPVGGKMLPRCETKNVSIKSNETQEINLFCDTGIR